MATMFETIRELPLFKGIGEEQLSQMLEKTSLEFLKIEEGELIHKKGDSVTSVDFILGGKVSIFHDLDNYEIQIEEILTRGSMTGAMNLYGMDTRYPTDIKASGKVSLMRVTKSQYMNILMSDRIFVLNFVNYLSAAAQKGIRLIEGRQREGIDHQLKSLVKGLVSSRCKSVVIKASDAELAEYCGVEEKDFQYWKEEMVARREISSGPNWIEISSLYFK